MLCVSGSGDGSWDLVRKALGCGGDREVCLKGVVMDGDGGGD